MKPRTLLVTLLFTTTASAGLTVAPDSARAGDETWRAKYDYYKQYADGLSIPREIHKRAFLGDPNCSKNIFVSAINSLDLDAFWATAKADKAAHPDWFLYDRSGPVPPMMAKQPNPYKMDSGDSQIRRQVSEFFQKIGRLVRAPAKVAESVDFAVARADKARQGRGIDCARMAVRIGRGLERLVPQNPQLKASIKRAEASLNKHLRALGPSFRGKLHGTYLGQVIAYRGAPVMGSEDAGKVTKTVELGDDSHLIAYLTKTQNKGGRKLSIMWQFPRKDPKEWRWSDSDKANQTMFEFSDKAKREKLGEAVDWVFPMWPTPAQMKGQSHLAYLPHLQPMRWWLQQAPGTYKMRYTLLGNGQALSPLAQGVITVVVTDANKATLKAKLEALTNAKIDAVTFPNCGKDFRKKVANANELAKYGKLTRLTMPGRGQIMMPYPNQHKVQWETGSGYSAFVKDGKAHVMALEFRRKPGAKKWRWWSVGSTPNHYPMGNARGVKPTVYNFGYEMRPAMIKTCAPWR